jgi:D-inositol-3-phosphate glycosyltransferase
MKVALLTGGAVRPYSLGLLDALVSRGIVVDFIGNDDMSTCDIVKHNNVNFLNLRGDQKATASKLRKITRVLTYYLRLIKYVTITDIQIFHIQWINKFVFFDRTILNIYYKLLGKKLVFTAHNIDERERDGGNNFINRLTLKIMYKIVDHIFVHTQKMKVQLIMKFGVPEDKIDVIPHGIINTNPTSELTRSEARSILELKNYQRILLSFGYIAPYKGLEYALLATELLRKEDDAFCLIIAGQVKGCQGYWERLDRMIETSNLAKGVIKRIGYVQDKDVEALFKCADILLLPYRFIYQSGIISLAYNFGLPVIATDVGSMREEIIEGKTGLICRLEDPGDLADKIRDYFDSDMYRNFEGNRKAIMAYGNEKYSWDKVAGVTLGIYETLLARGERDLMAEKMRVRTS